MTRSTGTWEVEISTLTARGSAGRENDIRIGDIDDEG
jgi:hypothetical protein